MKGQTHASPLFQSSAPTSLFSMSSFSVRSLASSASFLATVDCISLNALPTSWCCCSSRRTCSACSAGVGCVAGLSAARAAACACLLSSGQGIVSFPLHWAIALTTHESPPVLAVPESHPSSPSLPGRPSPLFVDVRAPPPPSDWAFLA